MAIPALPGRPMLAVSQPQSTGVRPTASSFAAKLTRGSATGAAPSSPYGVTGRQVISTVLQGITPARSYASILPGEGAPTNGDAAALTQMIDDIKEYVLVNSIFDAANMPIVERD